METRMSPPMVSVVVPNYNGAAVLGRCLASLNAQSHEGIEVIVVDNASTDASEQIVRSTTPRAAFLRQQVNLGFAGAANAGIRAASGAWVAILNNDTETDPSWIAESLETARRHPGTAFVAPRIMDFAERNRVFSAGDCALRAGIGYRRGQDQKLRPEHMEEVEVFAPTGCAALFRKEVLELAGAYEERFFAYLEDVELGIRLRATGHTGWYSPRAVIYHLGGATSGGEFSPLAVRMRTRNSILVPLRAFPPAVLARALPMIALSQAFWFGRALSHGRLLSYLRGIAGAVLLAPAMLAESRRLIRSPRYSVDRLRLALARSEAQARFDVEAGRHELGSAFLDCYFHLFRVSAGQGASAGHP